MTCCPWMNEHGLTCAGAKRFVDEHVKPCLTCASEKAEVLLEDLRAEVREKPVKTLVVAGLAGLVLGLTIAAARR
ncbi:hypothetical protein ACELLULO517_23620 [Acidisoma cellulosilytica]|uniref:DUF883 domain-containing protein n=1 Tax=Acidisoma cellulosilyticum TaxID=2802395 RepID=A0A964E659_9PROT|nr:hypothetical protein [Acidisoma cellulosilyticum]MCB8883259.1 hypothetical protein [Acidisoma cellulosilyticum]